MTTAALLNALLTYGPTILPLIQKLVADIEAGKANNQVASADIAELLRLGNQSAADIFKREGVALPT